MDFDFGFDDFSATIEDFSVKKKKAYDALWKIGYGGAVSTVPLVENGKVFFGACDFYFYCISTEGEELWRFRANEKFFDSSPVLFDGAVYSGNYDGNMRGHGYLH